MNSDFRALRRLKGLSGSYVDGFERKIRVADEIIQKFLTRISGAGNFAEEKRRIWQRTLEPAIVTREGEPIEIVLRLSNESDLHWKLVEEGGAEHSGSFQLSDGECLREARLDDTTYRRMRFHLPIELPLGYHYFELGSSASVLIMCPKKAFLSPSLKQGRKHSGVALNLYRIRTDSNWGIGDFGDLKRFSEILADKGCDFIGLNPLSSVALNGYDQFSPYSPSSRHALDLIYLDMNRLLECFPAPTAVEMIKSREFLQKIDLARKSSLLDFSSVAQLKISCARHCFDYFLSSDSPAFLELKKEFTVFIESMSSGQIDFINKETNSENRTFIMFLQWQLHFQLEEVRKDLSSRGYRIGLYLDFPLSASGTGAEVRSNSSLYVAEATVGAPSDHYNAQGQSWGFPPLLPDKLAEVGYEPFIAALRSTMRHSDMIRIDHILGFARLYCIPDGHLPKEGLYLKYPMRELLDILCLESVRNSCVVVGEDLGTVPVGFQKELKTRNIFSYCMLFFSRDSKGEYIASSDYAELSMLTSTTHDFPPLKGYATGVDLEIRNELNLLPGEGNFGELLKIRSRDMKLLSNRLELEGFAVKDEERFLESIIEFVKTADSLLVSIPLEDIIGETAPINIPGVSTEYPCWKVPLRFQWDCNLPDFSRQ